MPFGRTLANTLSSVVISHGQLLLTAAFDVDLRTWVFWALPAAGDTAKGWGGGVPRMQRKALLQLHRTFEDLGEIFKFQNSLDLKSGCQC